MTAPGPVRSPDGREWAKLVERVRAGDASAEHELVQRAGAHVARVLRRCTRDPALTQDLYQETFRLAIQKIRRGELRQAAKARAFIAALARNLAVDHYRSEARHRKEPLETGCRDPQPDPLERVLAREHAALVHRAISELELERDRELLFRFYITEEDKDLLCAELGVSPAHFNRILFRARRRCRELYQGYLG